MVIVVLALTTLLLMTAAFLLGRHLNRRQYLSEQMSLVTRQHIHLFQGGQLNEELVEATKARFRELLERGAVAEVEASMRPGIQYVVQVRALTEIGTEDAGRILERQLHRRLTDDELEQSWYWLDLANGLRIMNRQESLPHLLRCADSAAEVPLGQFFAAETVCFLGFGGYLQQIDTPLGSSALRVLHRALEGLRNGVQPQMVIEARLGEVIERLWDYRPEAIHPLLVRVLVETLRFLRRAPQAQLSLGMEGPDHESFNWQVSRLAALEPMLADYLDEASPLLRELFPRTTGQTSRDVLQALMDLRAETADLVLPALKYSDYPHADIAIESLVWSKDKRIGPWLREKVKVHLRLARRSVWRVPSRFGLGAHLTSGLPLLPLLRALRGHASRETERTLLQATELRDEELRMAAISSLGWWEPVLRGPVVARLGQMRRDTAPPVRQAARASLARLGERQSLQWFRQALTSEDAQQVHEAVQMIAVENLMLLWPDLDRLADADNPDVAQHAREAVHRLFEEMDWEMRNVG